MKRWKHNFKKGMALVLSLAMVAGLVPAMSGGANTVQAATGSGTEPSVTAYATKEQLMNGTFKPDTNGTATTIGKLVFGTKSDGTTAQEWYILGRDTGVTGDNTIIFAASPIATDQVFEDDCSNDKTFDSSFGVYESDPSSVDPTHYGASELRGALKNMVDGSNTTYFTTAEQGLMNATAVKTKDTKNNVIYTTTDKLYALQEDFYNDKKLWAGTSDNTALARDSYWSSGKQFWLRSPSVYRGNALLANPGDYVYDFWGDYRCAVQPASNLNLSSVLFASAAKAASSDTAESDTIASGAAMTLRLGGTGKDIGTVTYNTTTGDIKAVKATSQTVALVVQGNDGTNNWYYSKKITGTDVVNVSDIVAEPITPASIDLSACKIWLEATDSTKNLTYAVNATETTIKIIHSVAITDIETPVSNTALDTEASCTTEGVSSTTPQITWTPSDITAGYNKSYTASITLTADTGYEFTDSTTATINGNSATSVTKNADGTLTVTYAFPATANPVPAPVSYKILDGANSDWKQNTEETITIRGNGDFSKFVGVKIDGSTIDAKNYTAKEGSTIITLTTDYLKTLSIGTHTFEIVWTDGSAGTSFTVSKNDSGSETSKDDGSKGNNDNPNNNSNNNPATVTTDKNQDISGSQSGNNQQITAPKTGDNNHLVMWVTLLGVSLAGLLSLLYMRKKKDNE